MPADRAGLSDALDEAGRRRAAGKTALHVGNKDNMTPLCREPGITVAVPEYHADVRVEAGH